VIFYNNQIGETMNKIDDLIAEVKESRICYIEIVRNLSVEQGLFKPSADSWSVSEITEHLVHAEFGGIVGMWKALEGLKKNDPPWKGEHTNKGLTIEEVVDRTWKEKENVPEGAGPRFGGPHIFWTDALNSCQFMLERLAAELRDKQLDTIIYPHPISGPLDAGQRFAFLRFHMDRHRNQVKRIMEHNDFPDNK
jgi:hypothetical protein